MKTGRFFGLLLILVVVAGGSWWFLAHRAATTPTDTLQVYYTKASDGTSEVAWNVSMRPPVAGESAAEHARNTALYAALQSVIGPANEIQAVRFPTGTHVIAVDLAGSIATVNLSKEVESQTGGTFGENGEFKSLVYTLTGLPGIDGVQVLVEGRKLDSLPGGHVELDQPLHRSDF